MNSYLGESNLTKPGLSQPQARSGSIICSPPHQNNKKHHQNAFYRASPPPLRQWQRSYEGTAPSLAFVFQVMPDVRLKDWTTIKGRLEPEGMKKQGRHKKRREGGGGTRCRDAVQY